MGSEYRVEKAVDAFGWGVWAIVREDDRDTVTKMATALAREHADRIALALQLLDAQEQGQTIDDRKRERDELLDRFRLMTLSEMRTAWAAVVQPAQPRTTRCPVPLCGRDRVEP